MGTELRTRCVPMLESTNQSFEALELGSLSPGAPWGEGWGEGDFSTPGPLTPTLKEEGALFLVAFVALHVPEINYMRRTHGWPPVLSAHHIVPASVDGRVSVTPQPHQKPLETFRYPSGR